MKERKVVFLAVIGVLLLISPFGIVGYLYRKVLSFAPARFINDLFGFVISLLGILVGFCIGQVYWKRKTDNEEEGRSRGELLHYIGHIAKIVYETGGALARPIGEEDATAAIKRDQDVVANLRRLGDAAGMVLTYLDHVHSAFLRQESMAAAGRLFRTGIVPVLLTLSQRDEVRPDGALIQAELRKAGNDLDEVRRLLREV